MNQINRREALKVTASVLLAGTGISANRPSAAKRADSSTSTNAMHKPIKPPKLVPQDTVGIVSPASAFFTINEPAFQRGIAYLEGAGLRVQVAPHTLDQRQHLNPPTQHRAEDLNQMFADPKIKAIFCLSGGSGVNAVLPLLDWGQIERSPKIVMGYSAITALLIGLYAKVGLATFHGPMMLNGFSEYPQPFAYTWQGVEQVLFKTEPVGTLKPPAQWTDTCYTSEDQPRAMKTNPGWRWLREGKASGRLIGGNLSIMLTLVGTPYWAPLRGAILYLEEVNYGSGLLREFDELLAQCQQMGLFDQIAGLVIGKVNELSEEEEKLFESLILEYTAGSQFPILTGVDFGHTAPQLTLPIGIQASLNSQQDRFSINEAAVR